VAVQAEHPAWAVRAISHAAVPPVAHASTQAASLQSHASKQLTYPGQADSTADTSDAHIAE
jgi:hypothetical protein